MLVRMNTSSGGGAPSLKQTFTKTLNKSSWTDISSDITESGVLCAVIVDNYNGVQWRNDTKGTSGYFTNYTVTTDGTGYAAFEVGANDTVLINSNSGANRHVICQIVG